MNYMVFFIALFSVLLTSLAQVALRKTMISIGDLPSSIAEGVHFLVHLVINGWFVTGMTLYIISLILWLFVLKKIEVSLAYPLSAMGFLITAGIGYFFLDENVNLLRILGLVLIVIGILVISRS